MKILITSALPYADGEIHLGHLAGCYLPADIYFRFQKLLKRNCIHICGTDEHGTPITLTAEKEKISPQKLVYRYHKNIKKTFDRLGIQFTHFSGTARQVHHKMSQEFFLRLYNKGYIKKVKEEALFCEKCQRFLPDRYIEGKCPHCGATGARGDQCEECGRWLNPTSIQDPRCKICGTAPVMRETFNLYFLLSKLAPQLEKWLNSKENWKESVRNYALSWIREGLQDRSITRDLTWGVPIPPEINGVEGKVMYVWFDAPIGYISSTAEWAKEVIKDANFWKEYWLDRSTKMVHFIGKDNVVFHTLIWPGMLIAHGDYVLPDNVPANEYLNIKKGKMSTSRGEALWANDLLKEYSPDYIRFALSLILPETKDTEFSLKDMRENVNTYLANNVGNLVQRVLSFIYRYFNGQAPSWTLESEVLKEIEKTRSTYFNYMENFNIRDALKETLRLSNYANRHFDHKKPWELIKKDKKKAGKVLSESLALLNSLRILLHPFIPFSMEKLGKMLNQKELDWKGLDNPFLSEGTELPKSKILFKKLESIEKEERPYISHRQFSEMNLRIGEIIKVERIKGADKLLKIVVSLGNFESQLVAGIAQAYSESELVGKKILVITNLEPKRICGVESQGMLLAVDTDDGPVLLTPEKDVFPGSKVK